MHRLSTVAGLLAIACSAPSAPAVSPFTFRIRLAASAGAGRIHLQTGTLQGPQSWVSLVDANGNSRPLSAGCGYCSCDECGGCPVCGASEPTAATLEAGGQRDERFNGFVYLRSTCGPSASTCQTRTPLAEGAYVARFCWGTGRSANGVGGQITNETCADVRFTVPVAGGVVEHVVERGG